MSQTAYVAELLKKTLGPDQASINEATQQLDQIALSQGFSGVLFSIILDQTMHQNVIQAAIVYFKNLIVFKWIHDTSIDSSPTILPQEKEFIKQNIVMVFIKSPMARTHLRASIEFISAFDFPHAWEGLLPQLHSIFNEAKQQNNLDVMTACMSVLCSVVRNFISESESDDLISTIKNTASIMGQDIVFTINHCITYINTKTREISESIKTVLTGGGNINESAIQQNILEINQSAKLLYYLLKAQYFIVFHDITGIFENKIKDIMSLLLGALNIGKEINNALRSILRDSNSVGNKAVTDFAAEGIYSSIGSEYLIKVIMMVNKSISHFISICYDDISDTIPVLAEAVYNNTITVVSGDCNLQTCQPFSNINVINNQRVSNKQGNKCIVTALSLLETLASTNSNIFKNPDIICSIITGIIIPSVVDVNDVSDNGMIQNQQSYNNNSNSNNMIPVINENMLELVEDDPMLYIQSIIVSNIGNASVQQGASHRGALASAASANTNNIGNTGDNKVSYSIKLLARLVETVGEEAELMINSAIIAILLCIGSIPGANIQSEISESNLEVIFNKLCSYYKLIGKEINPEYLKMILTKGALAQNMYLPYYYTNLFNRYVNVSEMGAMNAQDAIQKNKRMLLVTVMHMNMALNGNTRKMMAFRQMDQQNTVKIFSNVSIQDSFVNDIVIPQLDEANKKIQMGNGEGMEPADIVVLCESLRYSILSLLSNSGISTITSSSTVMTENSLMLVKNISNYLISYITKCHNFVVFTYSSLILSVIINYKYKASNDPTNTQVVSVLSKGDISNLLEPLCNFIFNNIRQVQVPNGGYAIDLSGCYLLNGPSGERYANPYILDLLSSVINNCAFEALYNNIFKPDITNNVLEVVIYIVSDILKPSSSTSGNGIIASAAFESSLFGVLASIINTITDVGGSLLKITAMSGGVNNTNGQLQNYLYNNNICNRLFNLPIVNSANFLVKSRYNSISPNEINSSSIQGFISGISQTSKMLESKLMTLFGNIIQAVTTYPQQNAPSNLIDSVTLVLDLLSKMVELGDIVGQLELAAQANPSGLSIFNNGVLTQIFSSQIINSLLSQSLWSYPGLIRNLSILMGNIGAYSYISDTEVETNNPIVNTESAARGGILECASLLVSRYAKLRPNASKIVIGCAAGKRISKQASNGTTGQLKQSMTSMASLVSEFYTITGTLVAATSEQHKGGNSSKYLCLSLLLNLFSSLTADVFCPILILVGKGAEQGNVKPNNPIVSAACAGQNPEELQLIGMFLKDIVRAAITVQPGDESGVSPGLTLPLKKNMIMSIVSIFTYAASPMAGPFGKLFALSGVAKPHPLAIELLTSLATLYISLNTRTSARRGTRVRINQNNSQQVTEGMNGSSLCPCGVALPTLSIADKEVIDAILSLQLTRALLSSADIPPEALPVVG